MNAPVAMAPVPHLWDSAHRYYCNEGNYYTSDNVSVEYGSFAEFMEAEGDSDPDYNLLFRWDWTEEREDGKSNFTGDTYYRNGTLKLFWMGQRKGLYRFSLIQVCRADEPAVIEFLRSRWDHLRELWAPIAPLTEEAQS